MLLKSIQNPQVMGLGREMAWDAQQDSLLESVVLTPNLLLSLARQFEGWRHEDPERMACP